MKRIAAVFAFWCVLLNQLLAQHESDWIRFDQTYVKIPIAADGIYRLTYSDLQAAGFPVTADPRKLQLFHRGEEHAILVFGETDGVMNADDYIDFYGQKNDGTLDTELYQEPEYQPHIYHNIFSDTTWYFLTAGANTGKRCEVFNEDNTGLSPEQFHLAENLLILSSEYSPGKDHTSIPGAHLYLTTFDQGEGWMSPLILYNQPAAIFTLSGIRSQVITAAKPVLEMVITGRGSKVHPVDIFVGASPRLIATLNISAFESIKVTREIEFSDISAGELKVHVKVNGTEGPRVSVNYIKLIYPQAFDIDGATGYTFNLAPQATGKSYIEISNAQPGTRLFDVTDPANVRLIGSSTGTEMSAIISGTTTSRKIFAGLASTPTIHPVAFRSFQPDQHNYVILSHPLLRQPTSSYTDPVEAYGGYRASEAGGGFDTLILDINQVYDQFNYGEQSSLAIYHLMKHFAAEKLPDYLFIIGEGLDVYYNYFRSPHLFTSYKNLLPTAGYPGSDMAFTAGLGEATYGPAVATGRITATSAEEVAAYLNKVVESELRPFNDLRRKDILHLSGGVLPAEPQQFRSYLEEFEPIAENQFLGGRVSAIAKQSTDLELINIAEEVNKGVNLVTFFGHSSASTLDFDIGYVTDPVLGYDNKGRYPVLLMNGCDAGAFFVNGKLFGEDWINAANKGAIGFIAHSSLGYINPLRKYSARFYEVGYGDSLFITKGLGDIQKETARRYLQGSSLPIDISQVQQMILLGDPAVRLFGAPSPDYEIRDENILLLSMTEEPVTAFSDSIAISFVVRNFGQATDKPLHVEIARTLADRSVITYDTTYAPVYYSDTLLFIIRGRDLRYAGNNTFAIKADGIQAVDELNEENNTGYLDYFIPLNSTQNIYPGEFSIVHSTDLSLSFQHTDILSGERIFLLDFDSVSTFDSPFKKSFTIAATVLARQNLQLPEADTAVYYWRTKLAEPLENESRDWVTSSFTYIRNGSDGWAQIAFPQFMENVTDGLVQDASLRRMYFKETKTPVRITTFGATSGKPADSVSLKISNAEYNLYHQGFGCRTNTINLVAFDRKTTVPYIGVPLQWFNREGRTCGRVPWVINSFTPSQLYTGNGDDVIAYIDNIATGDSVLLFSIGDAGYETWPPEAISKMTEVGISAAQIQSLSGGEPVIIFGRKGSPPGTAEVSRASEGNPQEGKLYVDRTMTGRFTSGQVRSLLIGPAIDWQMLDVSIGEKELQDSASTDVFGVTGSGHEVLLYQGVSKSFDLSEIDAEVYPYLRLVLSISDEVNLTAPQLNHWIVTHAPVAEGLIFYDGTGERERIQEGVNWQAPYGFVNAGNSEFNAPLTVSYKVFNRTTHITETGVLQIAAPAAGDTTTFNIGINTFGKQGLNDIEVYVNPKLVPEQYYENNIFVLQEHLEVIGEELNPVLDVSIDGRYPERNEFVSPSPEIVIRVWDENPNLSIADTTGISVFLSSPCGSDECPFQRISFSRPDVTWHPATDTSEFTVRFEPQDLADGSYVLRVNASDLSGNVSGTKPYEITFLVKKELTISVSLPYPNPVTDVMRFEVILSGDEEPVAIDFTIVAMDGSPVQKLDESHFDELHVGNNVITWQARRRDELLPGGVYIYHMVIQTSNSRVEQRGKIVLVR